MPKCKLIRHKKQTIRYQIVVPQSAVCYSDQTRSLHILSFTQLYGSTTVSETFGLGTIE